MLSNRKAEINRENELRTWPSPANDVFNIKNIGENNWNTSVLSVYNPDGTMMVRQKIYDGNYTLNTSNYPSGMYILKITSENKTLTRKFVVKH